MGEISGLEKALRKERGKWPFETKVAWTILGSIPFFTFYKPDALENLVKIYAESQPGTQTGISAKPSQHNAALVQYAVELTQEDVKYVNSGIAEVVQQQLGTLTERERKIIEMHIGQGVSRQRIGRQLGGVEKAEVGGQNIRYTETKALFKMRNSGKMAVLVAVLAERARAPQRYKTSEEFGQGEAAGLSRTLSRLIPGRGTSKLDEASELRYLFRHLIVDEKLVSEYYEFVRGFVGRSLTYPIGNQ
ncbi:hypothetical protein HYU20_02140 [Candidatus Woesearchaeota archaeon]|nr:hypothetical protein [Candidatus Woesearchaeota archaeon]